MSSNDRLIPRRRVLAHGAGLIAALSTSTAARGLAARGTQAGTLDPAAVRRWGTTLRGRVVLPGDVSYDTERRVWNLAHDRQPGAVVLCADAEDVVRALEFARDRGIFPAIRTGGHSQAGHSTCDGGLLIDIGGLTGIDVDADRGVARVAAGTRVGDLLKSLGPHGLVTPTGSCPGVAVAGLTLGGGENMLMARFGAVCDNVVAARVILADGRTVTASADEHPDLFWALRGGSGNFGVVTSFEYRVYPMPQLVSGPMFFPVDSARDTLARYRDLMRAAPDELQTAAGLIPGARGPILMVNLAVCGDERAASTVVDKWRTTLKPQNDSIRSGPYSANFVVPPVASAGSGSFLSDLSDEAIRVLAAQFVSAPRGATAMWNDYHGAVTRVPADAMAFPLRRRGYDLFTSAVWNTPAERAAAVRWVADTRTALEPVTSGLYVNNLDVGSAEEARRAYGSNFTRLAGLKARYDPANFFRLNHNIPPRPSA